MFEKCKASLDSAHSLVVHSSFFKLGERKKKNSCQSVMVNKRHRRFLEVRYSRLSREKKIKNNRINNSTVKQQQHSYSLCIMLGTYSRLTLFSVCRLPMLTKWNGTFGKTQKLSPKC
jgi:hypothetical protein